MDVAMLDSWLKKRKAQSKAVAAKKAGIDMPSGLTIHINVNNEDKGQKLPLTADGKFVATRDAIAKYPG